MEGPFYGILAIEAPAAQPVCSIPSSDRIGAARPRPCRGSRREPMSSKALCVSGRYSMPNARTSRRIPAIRIAKRAVVGSTTCRPQRLRIVSTDEDHVRWVAAGRVTSKHLKDTGGWIGWTFRPTRSVSLGSLAAIGFIPTSSPFCKSRGRPGKHESIKSWTGADSACRDRSDRR